jgi:hypothetical protein
MGNRFSPRRMEDRDRAFVRKIPRPLVITFLLAMCLLIAVGIYIGLHSRVLGPEY